MEYRFADIETYLKTVTAEGRDFQGKGRLDRALTTLNRISVDPRLLQWHNSSHVFAELISRRLSVLTKLGRTLNRVVHSYSADEVPIRGNCLPICDSNFVEGQKVVTPNPDVWITNLGTVSRETNCSTCPGRVSCPFLLIAGVNSLIADRAAEQKGTDFSIDGILGSPTQRAVAEAMGFDVQPQPEDKSGGYVAGTGNPVRGKIHNEVQIVVGTEGYSKQADDFYPLPTADTAEKLGCASTTVNAVLSDIPCIQNRKNGFKVKPNGCVGDTCEFFDGCNLKQII